MKVLATTVVRGTGAGEAHGSLYRVDLGAGSAEELLRWDEPVALDSRGGDRGLRGVAMHGGRIYVASHGALHALEPDGTEITRWTCPALVHAHEVALLRDHLLLVATGTDSLLSFDLKAQRFDWGVCIRGYGDDLSVTPFDPAADAPPRGITLHLNQVYVSGDDVFLSGRLHTGLFRLRGGRLEQVRTIPMGTHNVTPVDGEGQEILFNDTDSDRLCLIRQGVQHVLPVPRVSLDVLEGLEHMDGVMARQGFARGLLWLGGARAVAGSSPATVCLVDLQRGVVEQKVVLSRDVRHAVHGIAQVDSDHR